MSYDSSKYNPKEKRAYYLKYRNEILEKRRRYVAENREALRAIARKRYSENAEYREQILKYQKEYRRKNKKKILEYAKNYRNEFRKIVNDRVRRYRQTEKGRHKQLEKQRQRLAKIKFANKIGSHTLKEWKDLLEKCGYRCARCGTNKDITKDHIIPISNNGSNKIENIQPLCRSCNSRKRNEITLDL